MAPKSTLAGLLALTTLSSAAPNHNRLVEVDTEELVLPPQTSGGDDLWATVVSETGDTTEYFVACADAFSHPWDCKGPYKGVSVTQGDNSVSLKLDDKSYDCLWSNDDSGEMECVIGHDQEIISGDDLDSWIAEVTIVEPANLELRDTESEVIKRKGKGGKSKSKSKGSKAAKKIGKKLGKSGGGSGKNKTDEDNGVAPGGSSALPSTFAVAVAAIGFAIAL